MKKGTTLASLLCKLKKKKQKKKTKKDIDYITNCKSCEMKYIGETVQQFQARKEQHKRDIKNKWNLQPLKTQQETPD